MILYKIDETQYTEESILELAKFRGYSERVKQEQDVLDEDGNKIGTKRVEVDNPQEPIDYIGEIFKDMADNWVAERMIQKKQVERREQEKADIKDIKSQIGSTTLIEKV